jgi:uncharacterized protein
MLPAIALGLLIGLVIGGLGGGGGVLAVPALVYLLGQSAHDATAGSVIIVGTAAVVGVLARIGDRGIDWSTGIAFGVVGAPAAYFGTVLNQRVEQPVLLLVFAAITLLAAAAMLLNEPEPEQEPVGAAGGGTAVLTRAEVRRGVLPVTAVKIVICGAVAGLLTGFLGVGGGFFVVPALVVALGMPMTRAIGTGLLIIVLNAVAALGSRVGGMGLVDDLDWPVILPFTVAAVIATLVGKRIADRCSSTALTRAFAGMLLLVAVGVGVQSAFAL